MNRIYSMLHLLCISIVAMGCPTVERESALQPAKNTESREEGNVEFKPKKPKIEASPHCSEQGPNQQDLKQDPEQVKKLPMPEEKVIEEEGPKKETTSAAATAPKLSNAGSNTGTISPTGSSKTGKKDTVSSIEHPVLIGLSTLSNGVPLQNLEDTQEQQAKEKAQGAVKEVENIAVAFSKMVPENIRTLTSEVNCSSSEKKSKAILQKYEKSYQAGLKDPEEKIKLAQALVKELEEKYPNNTNIQSFRAGLNDSSATIQNEKTKFGNTVKNLGKLLGIGK
ncbi:MAG TPA: hypothetical protein VK133_01500 [Amoebophilaceae bacterium]|nr:hypothetical protein [Amoebophilaceae bacterium]